VLELRPLRPEDSGEGGKVKAADTVAKLVIRSYGGSEYEIPLDRDRVRGERKDSAVILDNEFASRNHVAIDGRACRSVPRFWRLRPTIAVALARIAVTVDQTTGREDAR
jgi:hypothetical protein